MFYSARTKFKRKGGAKHARQDSASVQSVRSEPEMICPPLEKSKTTFSESGIRMRGKFAIQAEKIPFFRKERGESIAQLMDTGFFNRTNLPKKKITRLPVLAEIATGQIGTEIRPCSMAMTPTGWYDGTHGSMRFSLSLKADPGSEAVEKMVSTGERDPSQYPEFGEEGKHGARRMSQMPWINAKRLSMFPERMSGIISGQPQPSSLASVVEGVEEEPNMESTVPVITVGRISIRRKPLSSQISIAPIQESVAHEDNPEEIVPEIQHLGETEDPEQAAWPLIASRLFESPSEIEVMTVLSQRDAEDENRSDIERTRNLTSVSNPRRDEVILAVVPEEDEDDEMEADPTSPESIASPVKSPTQWKLVAIVSNPELDSAHVEEGGSEETDLVQPPLTAPDGSFDSPDVECGIHSAEITADNESSPQPVLRTSTFPNCSRKPRNTSPTSTMDFTLVSKEEREKADVNLAKAADQEATALKDSQEVKDDAVVPVTQQVESSVPGAENDEGNISRPTSPIGTKESSPGSPKNYEVRPGVGEGIGGSDVVQVEDGLDQPIYQHGPIRLNREQEILQREYFSTRLDLNDSSAWEASQQAVVESIIDFFDEFWPVEHQANKAGDQPGGMEDKWRLAPVLDEKLIRQSAGLEGPQQVTSGSRPPPVPARPRQGRLPPLPPPLRLPTVPRTPTERPGSATSARSMRSIESTSSIKSIGRKKVNSSKPTPKTVTPGFRSLLKGGIF